MSLLGLGKTPKNINGQGAVSDRDDDPVRGRTWWDYSVAPPQVYIHDGTAWHGPFDLGNNDAVLLTYYND